MARASGTQTTLPAFQQEKLSRFACEASEGRVKHFVLHVGLAGPHVSWGLPKMRQHTSF